VKYIEGFRDRRAAEALHKRLAVKGLSLAEKRRTVRIMEVCGTHTMAIARYGVRSLLPEGVKLISGPGCPVCVTDSGYIDAAIELANKQVVLASFGDMLRVRGSHLSLEQCRAQGAKIIVCYSPLEALKYAEKNPSDEVVFLGIGFETTVPAVLGLVQAAIKRELANISVLHAFKCVVPAMELLAQDPEVKVDAFLCAAHVSAIIGADSYRGLVERFGLPCVVAGFEPLDILLGLDGILEQIISGRSFVDNQYNRVVRQKGNRKAQALLCEYLMPCDAVWRGLGALPASGLAFRPEFSRFDAAKRHGIEVRAGLPPKGCRCGDVLKGLIEPEECRLFGRGCSPEHPVGPCMVSS